MRAEDAVAAAILREQVAAEDKWIAEAGPDDRERQVARLTADIENPDVGSWVAVADGTTVGTLGISKHRGLAQLGMLIDHNHRRQGIGRRLLTEALAWAKSQDCHKVVLDVWPHNGPARGLYVSASFREEGWRPRHYRRKDGSLWDMIEMGLVLDETSPGAPYQPADPGTGEGTAAPTAG